MTDLKSHDWQDKTIHNYLVIYQFRSRLANLAFEDFLFSNFKKYCINSDIENVQNIYLSIPCNRENILSIFKNLIFQINNYIENTDFLYVVGNSTSLTTNLKNEQNIISAYEIIKEQDKNWSEIVKLFQLNFREY